MASIQQAVATLDPESSTLYSSGGSWPGGGGVRFVREGLDTVQAVQTVYIFLLGSESKQES